MIPMAHKKQGINSYGKFQRKTELIGLYQITKSSLTHLSLCINHSTNIRQLPKSPKCMSENVTLIQKADKKQCLGVGQDNGK